MSEKEIVSIIMPAYNVENYIQESINSVINQTFTSWELIIVDDGSTDSTAILVKEIQAIDARIKYMYQLNRKQAAARNTGLKVVKGEYIAFLDADDIWLPSKLEKQIECFHLYNSDIVFNNGYFLKNINQELTNYDSLYGEFSGNEMYNLLMQNNVIPNLSVIAKRSLIEKIGLQDESLGVHGCEDWDYWLRMAIINSKFYGMNERLFKYRKHENGTSNNNFLMLKSEFNVLTKNYRYYLIGQDHKTNVISHLELLARKIVCLIYDKSLIGIANYYLSTIFEITKKTRYKFAIILNNVNEKAFRKIIIFILFH